MIIAAACPLTRPLAVRDNLKNCLLLAKEAQRKKVDILLFPPECLVGVTAGALANNPAIQEAVAKAEQEFSKATAKHSTLYLFNLSRDVSITTPSGRMTLKVGEDVLDTSSTLLLNPSISAERVDTREKRLARLCQRKGITIYTSPSAGESTSREVYSGATLILRDGVILAEGPRWTYKNVLVTADTDAPVTKKPYRATLGAVTDPATPFIPFEPAVHDQRMADIFAIQTTALATRLRNAGINGAVIGLSGGLDSTLALLVTHAAFKKLGYNTDNIHCYTLPGFGTTSRTKSNAQELAEQLHLPFETISIVPACRQHFKDIGHNPENHDVVYENAQARERSQILMDLANKHNALVIGTGDLSEIALGWCTFSGDQICHYAVNGDLPKTLMRHVVGWYAEYNPQLAPVLHDILETPISPELVPGQKTESIVGPYELHDYFLYHFMGKNRAPLEIYAMAKRDFPNYKSSEIKRYLNLFTRRLITQHFKRACTADYPIIGNVNLDASCFPMPTDADWRTFQI